MSHLENISKLFSKSFVENPVLETFEAENLHISSGFLVASDPLITPDKPVFTTKFPLGNFPVLIHKEKESNCIAYVEVVFGNKEITSWEMAVCDGQNISDLEGEEIFGYPVESGMGCFMDFETQTLLHELEQDLYHSKGVDFMGIYEEFFHEHFFDANGAIDQFASLKPSDEKENNILAFETGYGEGFYGTFIAFDSQNNPVKIISEFIEIKAE